MSVKKVSIEEIKKFIVECESYSQLAKKLGLFESGSTITRLKEKVQENGIDTSHFTGQRWSKGKTTLDDSRIKALVKTEEEMFCENSRANPSTIKSIIIKKKLLPYVCAICNIEPFWNEKILKLQMDHINGIRSDHRLENLRMLCPNCHSQTETYCAKNKKRKYPTKEEIIKAVENTESIKQAIDVLGINNSNRLKLSKLLKEENLKQKEKQKINKFCLHCSKQIHTRAKKYCSQECATLAVRSTTDPSTWIHGTETTYNYRKCRCALCKKSNTERKKAQRNKKETIST